MEDSAANDQSSGSGRPASRLLRYSLRSTVRSKEEKPPLAADSTNSASATKRERLTSSVSKSASVLDLSSKEKSAKPPRRLSVPSKSNIVPPFKSLCDVTPISEARSRSAVSQGESGTPASDVSRSSTRRRFHMMSSVSYWLSQIRLAESAAKHSVSLGFFKLALEAGCEPIQRMSEELKSYVQRHNLSVIPFFSTRDRLGECPKDLFESYKIAENFEPLQVSGTSSQVVEDLTDVNSYSSSVTDSEKPKAKSLDISADGICGDKSTKNDDTSHEYEFEKRTRRPIPKKVTYPMSISEVTGDNRSQKKPQKPIKQDSNQDKDKVKKQGKKSAFMEEHLHPPPAEEVIQENKENMATHKVDESSAAEV